MYLKLLILNANESSNCFSINKIAFWINLFLKLLYSIILNFNSLNYFFTYILVLYLWDIFEGHCKVGSVCTFDWYCYIPSTFSVSLFLFGSGPQVFLDIYYILNLFWIFWMLLITDYFRFFNLSNLLSLIIVI